MAFKDLHHKFKDLHHKLKELGVIGFLRRDEGTSYREASSWMSPISISHGFQVVGSSRNLFGDSDDCELDSVVAQRERVYDDVEVWSFGVFDAQIGDGVTKFLQSQLFDMKLKESQIRRKCKEVLKKAYLLTKAKIQGKGIEEESTGCTFVILIDGKKIVAANMGGYKVVVCKDGEANQICQRSHGRSKSRWSFIYIAEALRRRVLKNKRKTKSLEPVMAVEKVASDTEFLILASNGIWEVMKNQEAVNLIRHIHDPQEASECLAKEAVMRRTKGNISCLVIRFD